MTHQEETLRKTQDLLEGLCLLAGLDAGVTGAGESGRLCCLHKPKKANQ